uniref:PRA1 family protein n=1 Tax=Panagrolaimus sp. JU765 TaxID=591449 RepID=A0AC34Q399_9BILA
MFHPEYPDIRSKQYLIFGIHIRKLATILSAFSIVAEIILIAVARIDLFSYFFAAICIVSNVLVIYADKSEMPKYYWPFLVLTLIILVFGGIFILASIVLMIHFLISVFVGGAQFDQDVRVENFDDKFAPKTLGEGKF